MPSLLAHGHLFPALLERPPEAHELVASLSGQGSLSAVLSKGVRPSTLLIGSGSLSAALSKSDRAAVSLAGSGAVTASLQAGPWTPLSEPSLQRWVDFGDTSQLFQNVGGTIPATANNDPVALAKDKSGFGRDYQQGNVARRPRVQLADPLFAGRNVMLFDGVDDCLTSTYHASGARTLVLVCRTTAVAARAGWTWSSGGPPQGSAIRWPTNGASFFPSWCFGFSGTVAGVGINTAVNTNRHTLVIGYNGGSPSATGSYVAYLDNALAAVAATGSFTSGATLGAVGAGSGGANPGNLRIAEVIEFGTQIQGFALDRLRAWLAARYP